MPVRTLRRPTRRAKNARQDDIFDRRFRFDVVEIGVWLRIPAMSAACSA
jgi:hypothetical protein